MIAVLDSGPVGLITNPKLSPEAVACKTWFRLMVLHGHRIVLPEIVDYELRRELIRGRKQTGLARLDAFKGDLGFLRLDSDMLLKAAEFWAEARWRGQPTAQPDALDVDVILAAQAWTCQEAGETLIIATMNKKHLAQFLSAEHWRDITP
jgi:predicted nucleic acid-binding protein